MIPRTPLHDWISESFGFTPEDVSMEDVRARQLESIRAAVDFASAHSPFYRKHLQGFSGDALRGFGNVAKIPFTTQEDIRSNPEAMLCVSHAEIKRVTTMDTSGTSGKPKRIFFTADDLERTVDFFAHGMSTMVEPGQNVMLFMPGGKSGSVGDLLSRGLERIGVSCRSHGFIDDLEKAVQAITIQRSDCLVGLPSQILAVARFGIGKGLICPGDVSSVLLSGDPVSPALRFAISDALGCEVFVHYGLTETGLGGGVECRAHNGVHLREADLFVESIEPSSGLPVPFGASGEIVITTLNRRGMPLIRYRTEDFGRFLLDPCPCGTVLPRLSVKGRMEQGFSFAGKIIDAALLDDILSHIPEMHFHQARLHGASERQILEITVWTLCDTDSVLEKILSKVTTHPIIGAITAQGMIAVEIVKREDSSRLPLPGKRRIIDARTTNQRLEEINL